MCVRVAGDGGGNVSGSSHHMRARGAGLVRIGEADLAAFDEHRLVFKGPLTITPGSAAQSIELADGRRFTSANQVLRKTRQVRVWLALFWWQTMQPQCERLPLTWPCCGACTAVRQRAAGALVCRRERAGRLVRLGCVSREHRRRVHGPREAAEPGHRRRNGRRRQAQQRARRAPHCRARR